MPTVFPCQLETSVDVNRCRPVVTCKFDRSFTGLSFLLENKIVGFVARTDDNRNTGFYDSCFFACNFFEGVPQECHMIEGNICNNRG